MKSDLFNPSCIFPDDATSTPILTQRKSRKVSLAKGRAFFNWYQNFEKLVEFRNRHQHCLVPILYPEDPSLARWVKKQRLNRQQMIHGKKTTLDHDRIKMLNEIGFVWEAKETLWEAKLKELKSFKKNYGHCSVPVMYPPNPALGTWVKFQRRQYKLYKKGHPSYLTLQRILALETVGFSWEIRRSHAESTKCQSLLDSEEYRCWVEIYSDLHS